MSITTDDTETWFNSSEDEPADAPATSDGPPVELVKAEPPARPLLGVAREFELPWRPLRSHERNGPTNGHGSVVRVAEPPEPPPAPPPAPPDTLLPAVSAPEASTPKRRRKTRPVVAAGLVVAILAGAGTAAGLLISRAQRASVAVTPPKASTPSPLNLLTGTVDYEDDFSNPLSGWPVGRIDDGAVASYEVQGYTLTVSGTTQIHRAQSPYPYPEQSMSATVKVDNLTVSPGAGVGIECQQLVDNGFRYAFVLYGDGTYSVDSYPSDDDKWGVESARGNVYRLLKQNQPNTISGACINVPGPGGVVEAHVAMAVNGTTVTEFTDSLYLNGFGWTPALIAVSGSSQTYDASFRDFTIRDLRGPKPSL